MDAILLVDEAASCEPVRAALAGALQSAAPDDVVIVAFAGHGTQDHRLVMHDTQADNLPATTIDMGYLAELFRTCQARAVICLLDCCFSGGAAARVLDIGLAARALNLAEIGGQGRVLFTASLLDQEALEDSTTRHGLFTGAIVDALTAATAPVGVMRLAEEVQARVRARAAAMGYSQEPALFGHVEGGLVLPAGVRGAHWHAAFPPRSPVKVTGAFAELAAVGVPETVIEAWSGRYGGGLNALQIEAVNDFGVLDGESALAVAPTSAGKTFIGELAAIRAITEGRKAVFLLPYRALVNEKYQDFSALYGEQLGLRVVRCSGDWQDQVTDVLRGKYDIAFFTYEKFLSMAVASPHLLDQIGLVVLDEAQFITDPGRGMSVELLLTNIVSARQRRVSPQIVALSAVIGQTNRFEYWLGCRLLASTARPVPLTEGIMDCSGQWRARLPDGSIVVAPLVERHALYQRGAKPSSQDMIVPLVQSLVRKGEKVIVFRNRRGPALGAAQYLAEELGLPAADDALDQLPEADLSASSDALRAALRGGVAFHHSDLNRDERVVVEQSFRQPHGGVQVLVATSTLAAGINTPASTVVIVETQFPGDGGPRDYTVAQFKNMAGRAGRLGFEAQGKAIALADTPFERDAKFRQFVTAVPEAIRSSFDPHHPETWVIRLLAQVRKVPRAAVVDLVCNTFGGFLATSGHPGWRASMIPVIERLLERMVSLALVTDEAGILTLTPLGKACGESPLTLESAMRLVDLIRRLPDALHSGRLLLPLLQALPERDAQYTPQGGRGNGEPRWQSEAMTRYGYELAGLLRAGAQDNRTYYGRCKRALVIEAWLDGVPMADIERDFTGSPFAPVRHGDITGMADGTRFLLESARRIAAAVTPDPTKWDDTDILLKRLEEGLPEAGLALTGGGLSLRRGEILALLATGFASRDALEAASRAELEQAIGRRAAAVYRLLHPESSAPAIEAAE